jgi:hypothetical protein
VQAPEIEEAHAGQPRVWLPGEGWVAVEPVEEEPAQAQQQQQQQPYEEGYAADEDVSEGEPPAAVQQRPGAGAEVRGAQFGSTNVLLLVGCLRIMCVLCSPVRGIACLQASAAEEPGGQHEVDAASSMDVRHEADSSAAVEEQGVDETELYSRRSAGAAAAIAQQQGSRGDAPPVHQVQLSSLLCSRTCVRSASSQAGTSHFYAVSY